MFHNSRKTCGFILIYSRRVNFNILLLFFIMAFSRFGYSQGIICSTAGTVNYADPNEVGFYNRKLADPNYDQITVISVANILNSIPSNGLFGVDLPGDGFGSYTYKLKRTEIQNDTTFKLYAELFEVPSGASSAIGYFHIIVKNHHTYGYISVNNTYFTIFSLNSNNAVLCRSITPNPLGKECETDFEIQDPEIEYAPCGEGKEIDILFVFAPLAAFSISTTYDPQALKDYAELCVAQANTALANSRISSNTVRFRLVDAFLYEMEYENNLSLWDTWRPFHNDSYIDALRDIYNADIVTLVATNLGGPINGRADVGLSVDSFRVMVGQQNALANLTYSHELAHTLAALHQQCTLTNFPSCDNKVPNTRPHGYKYTADGIAKRTLMHTISTAVRTLQYSSPLIYDGGVATGTLTNDVAGQIAEVSGCIVSDYRERYPYRLNILAPLCVDVEEAFTCSVTVTNGVAPYNYTWWYSLTPNTWVYAGANATANFIGPKNYDRIYIRVLVTDAAGNSGYGYETILTPCEGQIGGLKIIPSAELSSEALSISQNFNLYPAISTDQINLESKLATGAPTYIKVVDLGGKVVFSQKFDSPSNRLQEVISIRSLLPGTYFCRIISKFGLETHKFTKANY